MSSAARISSGRIVSSAIAALSCLIVRSGVVLREARRWCVLRCSSRQLAVVVVRGGPRHGRVDHLVAHLDPQAAEDGRVHVDVEVQVRAVDAGRAPRRAGCAARRSSGDRAAVTPGDAAVAPGRAIASPGSSSACVEAPAARVTRPPCRASARVASVRLAARAGSRPAPACASRWRAAVGQRRPQLAVGRRRPREAEQLVLDALERRPPAVADASIAGDAELLDGVGQVAGAATSASARGPDTHVDDVAAETCRRAGARPGRPWRRPRGDGSVRARRSETERVQQARRRRTAPRRRVPLGTAAASSAARSARVPAASDAEPAGAAHQNSSSPAAGRVPVPVHGRDDRASASAVLELGEEPVDDARLPGGVLEGLADDPGREVGGQPARPRCAARRPPAGARPRSARWRRLDDPLRLGLRLRRDLGGDRRALGAGLLADARCLGARLGELLLVLARAPARPRPAPSRPARIPPSIGGRALGVDLLQGRARPSSRRPTRTMKQTNPTISSPGCGMIG